MQANGINAQSYSFVEYNNNPSAFTSFYKVTVSFVDNNSNTVIATLKNTLTKEELTYLCNKDIPIISYKNYHNISPDLYETLKNIPPNNKTITKDNTYFDVDLGSGFLSSKNFPYSIYETTNDYSLFVRRKEKGLSVCKVEAKAIINGREMFGSWTITPRNFSRIQQLQYEKKPYLSLL